MADAAAGEGQVMTRLTTRRLGLMIAGLAGSAIALVAGQQQPSGAPVYTAAQAAAGRAAYQANCASCHVADLGGRNEAPQLAGGDFMNTWRSRTTKDLFDYMSSTMPPGGPSLGPDQYAEHRRLHPAAEQRGGRHDGVQRCHRRGHRHRLRRASDRPPRNSRPRAERLRAADADRAAATAPGAGGAPGRPRAPRSRAASPLPAR